MAASPVLLAWLFGERYGSGPPWRVTRRWLPGGVSLGGGRSPEGATGPAECGVRGSGPAAGPVDASVRLAAPSLHRTCVMPVLRALASSRLITWVGSACWWTGSGG